MVAVNAGIPLKFLAKITVFCCYFLLPLLESSVSAAFPKPTPRPEECRGNKTGKASEQNVADKFFKNYGAWQRPRLNSSDSVVVSITFVLSSINDILERERIMKISGYLSVRWMDEYRVWNDHFPYNCVDYIVLPATEVWLPDIALMNSEGRYTLMRMEGEKVRVYSNGYVIYSPGGTFTIYCDYDLSMFPFDYQTCAVKVESWRYTHQYMEFEFGKNVTIKYFTVNEQWDLVSTSQEMMGLSYMEPWNSFDHIEFFITVKRKVMYYMMNVIIPSILIAIAHLATFTLPVGDIEKINISFTCLLAYSVFQVMVVGDMPRSSDHIPLLSIYIDLQMAYIAFSMLGEGMSFVALNKIDENGLNGQMPQHVPRWLLPPAKLFSFIMCMSQRQPTEKQVAAMHRSMEAHKNHAYEKSNGIIEIDMVTPHGVSETAENGENEKTPKSAPTNFKGNHSRPAIVKQPPTKRLSGMKTGNTRSQVGTTDIRFMDLRQREWHFLAYVIERSVAVIYVLLILVTPLSMFLVYPLIRYNGSY